MNHVIRASALPAERAGTDIRRDRVRCTTADREAAIQQLNYAFSTGALSSEVLSARVQAAEVAVTCDELRLLKQDLPPLPAPPAPSEPFSTSKTLRKFWLSGWGYGTVASSLMGGGGFIFGALYPHYDSHHAAAGTVAAFVLGFIMAVVGAVIAVFGSQDVVRYHRRRKAQERGGGDGSGYW